MTNRTARAAGIRTGPEAGAIRTGPEAGAARPAPAPDDDRAPGWSVSEERIESLLGQWWRQTRPAWTELPWWDAPLREEVRGLLWLQPGPDLVSTLGALGPDEHCPKSHAGEAMLPGWPTPGHTPGWPCACQVVTAAAWQACASWLAARTAHALTAAAGSDPVEFTLAEGHQQIHDPAREELAAALRTSIPAMGNRIAAARALTAHPRLVELVSTGAITAWAGRLVTDHLTDLTPVQADQVLEQVATRVHQRLDSGRRAYHSAEVNRIARAARLRACPQTEAESRVRAYAERRVHVHPRGQGMATLVADITDLDAHRIHRRLTALAAGLQTDTPDTRTRDQLRADILVDLLLASPASPPTPTGSDAQSQRSSTGTAAPTGPTDPPRAPTNSRGCDPHHPAPAAGAGHDAGAPTGMAGTGPQGTGPQGTGPQGTGPQGTGPDPGPPAIPLPRPDPGAEVQVIITLPTLLGLADDPAEVPGLGPIPADLASALAADGRWRAWILDASGAVTATGTTRYSPTAAIARLVRAREPRCRFPGCHQAATRCDLDHAIPWPHGATTPDNLGPLCRRHHNLKTHFPWRLQPEPASPGQPTDRGQGRPDRTARVPESPGRPSDPGHAPPDDPASAPDRNWRWTTPAGLRIHDAPEPPLSFA